MTGSETTTDRIARLTAIAGLALFGVTWRLWTPQTVFPQIPFVACAAPFPGFVDWTLFACAVVFLLFVAILSRARPESPVARRAALLAFVVAVLGLMALDQHRLQPWAWQFVLIAVILATSTDDRSARWLRVLVIGIYAHSAISKFDSGFLQSHGQRLVAAALGVFGGSLGGLSESTRQALAFSLPLGELLCAISLCVPRVRRVAVVASIAMHAALFLSLGPWGLNHKPGVLIWNAFFIWQNVILFWKIPSRESEPHAERARSPMEGFAVAAVFVGVALPVLEPLGYFDHWPAWGLYASRPERVTVFVHGTQRGRLPKSVQQFTEQREGGWCRVDVDGWSLRTLDAPVYPQGRFRLAVALALAERHQLGEGIRVIWESPAHRRTGQRETRDLQGARALRTETSRFRINVEPRKSEGRVAN